MDCSLLKLTDAQALTRTDTDCIALGYFADAPLQGLAATLDQASDGAISQLIERGYASGKLGKTTLIFDPAHCKARRLLLVGCGDQHQFDHKAYRKALATLPKALRDDAICHAIIALQDLPIHDQDPDWALQHAVTELHAALYRYTELKNTKDEDQQPQLALHYTGNNESVFNTAIATARGVELARTLGNRPGNICTPSHLAEQAEKLAQHCAALDVTVLEQADMEEQQMGALLSVAKGSRQPPKLIVLNYHNGPDDQPPIALVGKGVTFDSGGISIKPANLMDEMKYDMGGAAAVLGAFCSLTAIQPAINVIGVIPATENMPDGLASKPGDVVRSMSGTTIEVLNTDAEGRLILCDALTYAQSYQPELIIDMATLTGACIVALGHHASAVYCNDDTLQNELLAAANQSGDRIWPMPLWDDYDKQLKSTVADVANIGGRSAGSITAACFLQRFIKDHRWAHLDIAGTAWNSGANKNATGRPVPLLIEFLLKHHQPTPS